MTDNTYRTRRDAGAPAPGGQQFEDPLAELARLIGQTPPAGSAADHAPQPQQYPPQQYEAPPLDARETHAQWADDPRYAQQYDERQSQQYGDSQYDDGQRQYSDSQDQYRDGQDQYREDQYRDSQYADSQYADSQYSSPDAPRLADPYPPPYRTAPSSYDEQPDQYAAPAEPYDTPGHAEQARYVEPPRYDDAHDPIQDVPAFLPRLRDGGYASAQARQERASARGQNYAQERTQDYGEQRGQDYPQGYEQGYAQEPDAEDQSYALEDYEDDVEDDAPAPRRRGFALVAGLMGLAVLCTAGWFGYRAMFGGSIVPSLPPIIKADGTPNKIVPAGNTANASAQAGAGASANKLVPREERPVDVPTPANTPRVVSTIPVSPDSNPGLPPGVMPGGQGMAGQNMGGAVASGFPAAGAPMQLGPAGAAPAYGAPAGTSAAPPPQNSPLQSPPVAGAANSKKIHTVAIHNGQVVGDNADAAQAAPAPQAAAPQSSAPARPQAVARPVAPKSAPAAQGGNAPLSIVPGGGGDAAAPRTRTAAVPRQAAEQAPSAAPSAGGGPYYVQVSSQRSEAEAQSAYRDLQAKFPSQLGGHAPAVRQVNLGEKGTFYRTLVGPYGSSEQAAQMCSSLKAAGGNCIVQRN
jgi:hypothetical protein